mmetsp:Transcript_41733/g.69713  ORF Transcript_41733/g.69713 Transcript_41733/m.69713 type:complete len:132 (-) Transcript_41733:305-700(-)|eukprot:CAMPEP_0198204066 /NCGR_PEP_ID=MMETSP1445-20131203/7429_1 /TAXON_ID=36898 /ORGANISM="Pyramimonas sp., Strain CCMP2087" /LENGTH=131 /DNA_ID=CAMNT_0043875757 /DNA_START=93 /DNA_END=488 /DNA_ORIENTATION=+
MASVSSICLGSKSFLRTPVASSSQSSMRGSQAGLKMARGASTVTMMKKDIHPEFFPQAKVICNGEEVISMGGTMETYNVDVWSGNHPFYQGSGGSLITAVERVSSFQRRYAGLSLGKIQGVDTPKKDEEAK